MTTSQVPGRPRTGIATEVVPDKTITHTPDDPKFPDIDVQLTGTDGHALAVIVTVRRALKRGGATTADISEVHETRP